MEKEEKKSKSRSAYVWGTSIAGGIVVLLALFVAWLYTGSFTAAKFSVFETLNLPLGKVGGDYLTVRELKNQSQTPNELGADIIRPGYLEANTQNIKIKYLVSKYDAARGMVKDPDVSPATVLAIWWAGNQKLNPRYVQMQTIETRLGKDENFKDLAVTYSEDDATKHLGGDAGYIDLSQALPEFRAAVTPMNKGDYKTVPTRYGLELVRVEDIIKNESGNTLTRIRHITLENKEYQSWLEAELAQVSVTVYVGR